MAELREYKQSQYKSDMKKLLDEKGLHDAVEKYCDDINEIASALSYLPHREIQECLCDILYLIRLKEKEE